MPIDPLLWANTPGLGMAPLQPAYGASGAAADPRADIARRLAAATGREPGGPMDPRERPQAFAPDPATLGNQQLAGFHEGYGGWNDPSGMGRAPASAIGGMTTLAGVGVPGFSTVMGALGNKGVRDYHAQLQAERTHRMAEAMEGGRGQMGDQRDIAPPRDPFTDAYERGRQAAGGGQSRDQRDIDRSQRGSRDTQHSIAI